MNTKDLDAKYESIKKYLLDRGGLAVAFSGGVDSTFLLAVASEILPSGKVLAITMDSPTLPRDELDYAVAFCRERNIRHKLINGDDVMENPAFAENPPDRCYHCKLHTFGALLKEAEDLPLADGTNVDDLSDYRPGMKALGEKNVISPLKDAGYTKQDIREGLRSRGISIWDKPACACLASRVPYGEPVTSEKMAQVFRVESALHELGFTQVRVRHHGSVARIEVLPGERRLFYNDNMMDRVDAIVKDAGFQYGAVDLGGYKMGNMNRGI